MENLIIENWAPLLLALLGLLKVIVNITPSEKDNKIFEKIDQLIDVFIPNLKKGGGSHTKNVIPGVKKK